VKLAAVLPAALTIECEVHKNISNCQGVKINNLFIAMDRKTISK